MIYGYMEKVADEEYGLLQMRQITLAMNPLQLRLLAKFALKIAEEIESGAPFLHRHIDESIPEWRAALEEVDVVATPPGTTIFPDIDS
jgi:hypothetical protein